MQCPRCQYEAPAGARFCGECGASLGRPCPACRSLNPTSHAFCSECGTALGSPPEKGFAPDPQEYTPRYLADKIMRARDSLQGERKQVTVLFADLRGSLELVGDRDPEEARRILDPVLEHMMEAVHRYEGTVNQVMGDGIMALFGAPLAHEDHAARACYAALAMQEAIGAYADQVHRVHGADIQIRVGVNSGEVVVRAIRNDLHMDYSAIGQTTHLAARMEQLAPPGKILITAHTFRLAERVVQVKPLTPAKVKGLAHPLEIFELVGAGPPRAHLEAFAGRDLTRFVGREAELAILHRALDRAGAGSGQVVAVIGEPGVGKTRLFYEFLSAPWSQGWLLLEGQAASHTKGIPYHPVRDLLRTYFQLEEWDDHGRMREKVTARIAALDPALSTTLPAVLALFDLPVDDQAWLALDPPQRRLRTLDGLKRLLLRECQNQPVLLVCENLHWIDTETEAFLAALVESMTAARLLLLVNSRPERPHLWRSKACYTEIRIDPLPPVSADELLRVLLGSDASLAPLKRALVERTEGNPFFLEESVRTLVESRVVLGEQGAYRVVRPLGAMPVPATVQAVLAARMDRLPAEEKTLLQTAAVIGKSVPLALLQEIAEVPVEALRGALAHLQSAEFLYEASLFPELVYTFTHALTQEVAYGSLLHERRRALHARIVEAIERLGPERLAAHVERLAYHTLRGAVWDKAVGYSRQAGAKAAARSAHREAVGYFEQALTALQHLPDRRDTREQAIDVRFALRSALLPSADFGRMLACLREAETLAASLEDQRRLGQVSRLLSLHFWFMGAHDEAIAAGQRARAVAAQSGDETLHALATLNLGFAYLARGDYPRAVEAFEQTMVTVGWARRHERFGQVNLPAVTSRAWLAWSQADVGAFDSGAALGKEAVDIAEAVAHPSSLMVALWGLGRLLVGRGDFAQALPPLERSLSICRDADLPIWLPMVAPPLGSALARNGRAGEAVDLLTEAAERSLAMGTAAFQAPCWIALGEAQMLAGRLGDALGVAERALALATGYRERANEAHALHLLGEIAARQDSSGRQALGRYQEALALAEELGMRPLQAHCHLALSALHGRASCAEPAEAARVAAEALYRALGMAIPEGEAGQPAAVTVDVPDPGPLARGGAGG